jgi:hypothetical protein
VLYCYHEGVLEWRLVACRPACVFACRLYIFQAFFLCDSMLAWKSFYVQACFRAGVLQCIRVCVHAWLRVGVLA